MCFSPFRNPFQFPINFYSLVIDGFSLCQLDIKVEQTIVSGSHIPSLRPIYLVLSLKIPNHGLYVLLSHLCYNHTVHIGVAMVFPQCNDILSFSNVNKEFTYVNLISR